MMAKANDDTKPTVEAIDRVIRDRECKDIVGQNMKKAIEERTAKAHQSPHFFLVGIGAESAGFVEGLAQSELEHRGGQGG